MWGDTSLWFCFAFLWWLMMLNIFSCACRPSVCILWKNVYSSLRPIFKIELLYPFFKSGYLFFWCWVVWVISFAYTFSHSVSCLFILSMVSSAVQTLLSLIRSHLFIFAFFPFALGHRSKKYIATIYVKECSTFVYF